MNLKKAKKVSITLITLSLCSSLLYLGDIITAIIYFTGLITVGIGIFKILDIIVKKITGDS